MGENALRRDMEAYTDALYRVRMNPQDPELYEKSRAAGQMLSDMIKAEAKGGMSKSYIAEVIGVDRKTVLVWMKNPPSVPNRLNE